MPSARRSPPELRPEDNGMSARDLTKVITKLAPLHQKLGKPKPGDWLAEHDEPGQTFDEYRDSDPVTPDVEGPGKRRLLYIQPLGALTKTQRAIVEQTAEYMQHFFGLEVRLSQELPLSLVPESARRVHPSWGVPQILTDPVQQARHCSVPSRSISLAASNERFPLPFRPLSVSRNATYKR